MWEKDHRICKGVTDLLFFAGGSLIYGISVNMFTAPNQIAPGGITGLSTLLNHLFGTPIGTVSFLMNLPLFFWALMSVGYKLLLKTFVATFMTSAAIDLMGLVIAPYRGDLLLASLFGGVLEGLGLSLVFIRGGTTGGSDLIARLLGRYVPHLSMAKLMMCLDVMVVTASAIVYQSIESAMYAVVVLFVSSRVIDALLYGTDVGTGKVFYIISEKNREIADQILKEMDRGVTFLEGRGGFTGNSCELLLCAVRRFEVSRVKSIIHHWDPKAFWIIGEAGEITGEGFRQLGPDDATLQSLLHRLKRRTERGTTE